MKSLEKQDSDKKLTPESHITRAANHEECPKKKQPIVYHRRSYEGLERLTKEVHALTQPILGKRGFGGVEIIENWTDIVGEDLAPGIRPEKLTFEKQSRINGTLHVKSAGGAFALLFEHHKQQVIDRINSYFGYTAVAQIKIKQGKLTFSSLSKPESSSETFSKEELEALQEKAALFDDEKLRETFYQTGLAFLRNRRR